MVRRSAENPTGTQGGRGLDTRRLHHSTIRAPYSAVSEMRCGGCLHPDAKTVAGEWKRRGAGPVLMVCGMNPGKMEVNLGKPFVGPSGRLLRDAVRGLWDGPIYVTNAVRCRPLGVDIGLEEVTACLPLLEAEIREVDPQTVLFLGDIAKSAQVRLREIGLLEGRTVVQHPHPAMSLGPGGMRQGAWVQSCKAAVSKALNPTPPIEIHLLEADTLIPMVVGSDTEYPFGPPWTGASIWALSDGDVAWAASVGVEGRIDGALAERLLLGRTIIFHNAVSELVVLKGMGARAMPADIHDTMVLAALDDEEGPRDLKVLASAKLGYAYDSPKKAEMAVDDRTTIYCGHDARATYRLYTQIYKPLADQSWLYQELYRPILPMLAQMSFQGIRVDVVRAKDMDLAAEARVAEIDAQLATFKKIKWSSDEQVAAYMQERGYPLGKPTQGGLRPSVDKEALLPLSRAGIPEATLVLERRGLAKQRSTYLAPIIDSGGIVRTMLNPVGAETGRISSGGLGKKTGSMNLQNVPLPLRVLYLPPEGMAWVEGDASQHEVRTLAWLAEKDLERKPLTSAVVNSDDFYRDTGHGFLGRMPTEEERAAFKTVVLAGQYLARAATLVRHLEQDGVFIERDRVEAMMEYVAQRYPTIGWWHEALFEQARSQGYITTPLGRKRSVFVGQGGVLTPEMRRVIVNSPVQGTASDFVLFALRRAWEEGLRLILTVHDSLDAVAWPNEVEDVAATLQSAIQNEPLLGSGEGWADEDNVYQHYLKVKVKVGPSWGSLVDVADYRAQEAH